MAFVTSINLVAGGDPVHVTVTDQNGNPLPPTNITWEHLNPISVSIVPDATGFNFTSNGEQPESQPANVQAIYNGPGNPSPVAGPTLIINFVLPAPPPVTVTALQYTSP